MAIVMLSGLSLFSLRLAACDSAILRLTEQVTAILLHCRLPGGIKAVARMTVFMGFCGFSLAASAKMATATASSCFISNKPND